MARWLRLRRASEGRGRGREAPIAPAAEAATTVGLIGLRYHCWRCDELSTPLIGMLERGKDLFSADFVVVGDERMLTFAWELFPAFARGRWPIGEVKRRQERRTGGGYLSNGCSSCDAPFATYALFHNALPIALATNPFERLPELARVELRRDTWASICTSRWN